MNDAFFKADGDIGGIGNDAQNSDFEDDLGFELSELMKQYKPADKAEERENADGEITVDDDFGDLFDDAFAELSTPVDDVEKVIDPEFSFDPDSYVDTEAEAILAAEAIAEAEDNYTESFEELTVNDDSEIDADDDSNISIDDLFDAAVGDDADDAEPVIEEPVIEEPVIEEPVMEELVAEETADSETDGLEDIELGDITIDDLDLDDIKLDLDLDDDHEIGDFEPVETAFEEPAPAEEDVLDYSMGADEIDDTDINLMLAFGLEDELEKTLGADKAKELKKNIDAEQKAHDEEKRRRYEYEYEFTDRTQIPGIVNAYKSTKTSLAIKLLISGFLALLLFFYENVTLFGVQFAGALDPAVYPVVYTMVGLQILLLACATAYEQILFGFRKLFSGRPVPETITSVLVLFAILYSVVVCTCVPAGYEPKLYFFPVSVSVFISLVFAWLNIKREIFAFNIVSSKKPKFAVRRKRVGNIEVYGGDKEDEIDEILEVYRVNFADNYFSRTYADSSVVFLTVTITLCLAVAAAVLLGVYMAITNAGLMPAAETVFVMLIAAMPVSMLITYSYPFYCANKKAYLNNSTIIGESSLEEYADLSVVTLDDKAVFPSSDVKVQNIRIYNGNRIDSVLYYASSVFSHSGGPLAEVFELATAEIGHSGDVNIVENSVGYLGATVDGKNIVFGGSDELLSRGFSVDDDLTDADSIMTEENVVMYMFIDGVMAAKMYIRYPLDPDFEEALVDFTAAGMSLCITTSDPNVDEVMLAHRISLEDYPVKVLKVAPGTEKKEAEHIDSGIASRGGAHTLLKTVTYCSKILRVRKTNFSISIMALFVSVVLVLLLSAIGRLGEASSLFVALYQLVWVLPVWLTSKLFIK